MQNCGESGTRLQWRTRDGHYNEHFYINTNIHLHGDPAVSLGSSAFVKDKYKNQNAPQHWSHRLLLVTSSPYSASCIHTFNSTHIKAVRACIFSCLVFTFVMLQ